MSNDRDTPPTTPNTDFVGTLAWPDEGLLPVVVQDGHSGEVLMQAWVNRQALCEAVRQRRGIYFSRSRQALWVKGETSGNRQRLLEVRLDCDADSLLYLVEQQGPACHTGRRSCYFRQLDSHRSLWRDLGTDTGTGTGTGDNEALPAPATMVLQRLQAVLEQRRGESPQTSYVAGLYRDGVEAMLAKVREEAGEVEEAARLLGNLLSNKDAAKGNTPGSAPGSTPNDRAHLVGELADLWFHSLVLLHGLGGQTADILKELEKRFGQSGLEEKRSRGKQTT